MLRLRYDEFLGAEKFKNFLCDRLTDRTKHNGWFEGLAKAIQRIFDNEVKILEDDDADFQEWGAR